MVITRIPITGTIDTDDIIISKGEARIAANIAKLPELLRKA